MGHRVLIAAALALAAGTAHAGGRVTGKITVTDANGTPAVPDVIVYVVGFAERATTSGPAATIAQKGRTFVPDLVAITVGQSVRFPNGDPFLHNVFSQSPARKFDLGSFKKGESKEKQFPTAGVVDVYCNIHPEMAATILVLPNRLYTHVMAGGSFAIDHVPPGTWRVFAYTRRALRPVSAPVTVGSGDVTVNFALVRGGEPEHLNKYGETYHDIGATYR